MIDDRKRNTKRSSGWTPQDLGLAPPTRAPAALAALTMAAGIGNLAGGVTSKPRTDRYPRPVQGNAELRRRLRQQERLAHRGKPDDA